MPQFSLTALRLRGARTADQRGGQNAVPSVEPAVRPPLQAVGDVVPDARVVPAIEHHLRFAVGHVVAVAIGNEEQARRTQRPDAAEADLDAGQYLALVPEDGALVEPAVVVGVFENDDAIAQAKIEVHLAFGVGVILGHPQPAARVGRHGDRILHVRLGGEDGRVKSGRQPEVSRHLDRRGKDVGAKRLGVEGIGKVGGVSEAGGQE